MTMSHCGLTFEIQDNSLYVKSIKSNVVSIEKSYIHNKLTNEWIFPDTIMVWNTHKHTLTVTNPAYFSAA